MVKKRADKDEEMPVSPEAETVSRWLDEIDATKRRNHDFVTRGDSIINRYKDKQPLTAIPAYTSHRMNVLWSNVETLMPAMYARTPKPEVERRNKDKDPVGRWASIVLERALGYTLGTHDFDLQMREAVKDLLLPGRGQLWVRYEPTFEKDPDSGEEFVSWEQTKAEYVHWKDFLTNDARSWNEVMWVARRGYYTRKQGLARFGEIFSKVSLDHKAPEDDKRELSSYGTENYRKGIVWEIWDKSEKKVLFISPGLKERPLQVMDPGVKFDSFFPCPRPLNATTATDSIIPVADFALYQDQADEIDLMTQKIGQLSKSLKLSGVYDATMKAELTQLLQDNDNTTLIPVENWSVFAGNGGFQGAVSWLPLADVVKALQACYEARDRARNVMYEVTGIGDVIRGATDPRETLGAQQLKSQWGSIRIRDRQKDIQRFARDIMRLMSEVIAEHFSLETLRSMTGVKLLTDAEKQQIQIIQQAEAQAAQAAAQQAQAMQAQGAQVQPPPPPPSRIPPQALELMKEPTWEQVIGLLRNDKARGFVIEIETDSTLQPDEAEDKQSAIELLGALTQFFMGTGPIMEKAPQTAPMFAELGMFVLRRFRAGETLETLIDDTMAGVAKQAMAPKQPDPAAIAQQQTAQAKLVTAQTDMFRAQSEVRDSQADAQIKVADISVERGWQQLEQSQQKIDVMKEFNRSQPMSPFGVQQ